MTNIVLPIIIGVVVFLIAMFILKSIIRAILIGLLALVVFRVGWVYSADELFEKYKLREVITEEYQDDIYNKYNEYTEKRDSNMIIDTEKIDNKLQEKEFEIKKELNEKLKNRKQKLQN